MTGRRTDPKPEQIEAACREIRATWSPQEMLKRLRVDLRPTYRRSDGRQHEIDAATYAQHHATREVHSVT
jgi:hypothetical protein